MRHVMFVDDDPDVLSGMRRMLHSMRAEWRMTFACSGPAAIAVFESGLVDVVVSDMRMPDMDGAELLAVVRRRWPGTVRMVLSGFADEGAALRSVSVAHRFLSKPCRPEDLLLAVRGACDLQDRLSQPELRVLVAGLGVLPSPPGSYAAITEALADPQVSAQRVALIIERNLACAAKLLQIVNSAFFGLARPVTSIRDAVAYLGLGSVRDVVLAVEVANLLSGGSPAVVKEVAAVHEQSVAVASAAQEMVPRTRSQDAFVAGLLHDVGRLALAMVAPEQFLLIQNDLRHGMDITAAEQQRLGASHADIGAYLLQLWGLPLTLVDAVARHHDPDAVNDADPVVAAVAVAALHVVTSAA